MKVAVSIPDPVFDAAERLAEQLHVPRSKLYAEAISEFLEKHGGKSVTAKLNVVYAETSSSVDPLLATAQSASIADEAW